MIWSKVYLKTARTYDDIRVEIASRSLPLQEGILTTSRNPHLHHVHLRRGENLIKAGKK